MTEGLQKAAAVQALLFGAITGSMHNPEFPVRLASIRFLNPVDQMDPAALIIRTEAGHRFMLEVKIMAAADGSTP